MSDVTPVKSATLRLRLFHGEGRWPRFHSTFDIIEAVEAGRFPDKAIPVKYASLRLRLFHGTSDDGAPAAVDG